jgi:hypothetical protein
VREGIQRLFGSLVAEESGFGRGVGRIVGVGRGQWRKVEREFYFLNIGSR